MHRFLLASAALALAAVPALAQTNTPAGPQSQMNQSGANPGSAGQMGAGQTGAGQTGARNGAIRQQITQQLSQAGFTEVHVMPESFLVRAKDPRGNPVMMVINPDSITAMTESGGQMAQGSGGAPGTGAGANSGQSGSAAGTSNGSSTTAR